MTVSDRSSRLAATRVSSGAEIDLAEQTDLDLGRGDADHV